MTIDQLAAFHEWLYDQTKREPLTVVELMHVVKHAPTKDAPDNGITMQQWLCRLSESGRAVRLNASGTPDVNGGWWKWAEGCKAVKVEQRSLFG